MKILSTLLIITSTIVLVSALVLQMLVINLQTNHINQLHKQAERMENGL
jgi:hypothetical protein